MTGTTHRRRPTRAGILNIWEYDAQEFRFGDGRLVLRGPNGSGKSNALALLFPFLLDGVMSASRMDALSGGRSMKSLLLCRDDESPTGRRYRHERRTGYLWLELDGEDGPVTIGAGVRASAQRDAEAWFFVTRRRVGVDLHLEVDRTPIGRADLVTALGPEEVFDSAEAYRAAVDRALFGIGPVRYRKLIELLLVLRRPHLAGKLDVELVSRTLSDGLPALDPALVADVAQSFDDLESMRLDLAQTRTSLETLDRFLPRYTDHLHHHVRRRAGAVDDADRRQRALLRDQRHLEADRSTLEGRLTELAQVVADRSGERGVVEAEIEAIKDSDAYRSSVALAELEDRVEAERRHHRQLEGALERAGARRVDAEDRLAAADRAHDAAATAAGRALEELGAATNRAGLELSEAPSTWIAPIDAERVMSVVRAGVSTRRVDLAEVRNALDRAEAAARRAAQAQAEADRAAAEADERGAAATTSRAAADQAATALADAMGTWLDRTVGAVAAAAAGSGVTGLRADGVTLEGGGRLDPGAVARSLLQPVTTAVAAARAERRRDRDEALTNRATVTEERARVAAAVDPGPPPSPTRPGAGDPDGTGVPLYACTDFRPEVPEAERPGWEAALHAAGILDARVLPSGAGVDLGEVLDARLLADQGQPRSGATLADVLAPTGGPGGDEAAVAAVLGSIELDGDLVELAPDGRWRLGPVAGRFTKDRVEFVGAEARERRRRERLALLDADLTRLDVELARLTEVLQRLDGVDVAVAEATATVPSPDQRDATARAAEVAEAVAVAAAERAATRRVEVEARAEAAQQADAELRRQAGQRRLPPTGAGLDEVTSAVDAADRAAQDTAHRLGEVAARAERREERARELAELQDDERARRAELVEAAASLRAVVARAEALRAASGAAAVEAVTRLHAATERRRVLGEELERARDEQGRLRAEEARLVERTAGLERELAAVAGEVAAAGDRLGRCRRAEVLEVVGLGAVEGELGAVPFARQVLDIISEPPEGASERMKQAFSTVLLDDLRAGFDPMLVEVDGLDLVRIGTDEGEVPVGELAARLRSDLARLDALLSERERQIFETHLLTRVSEELRTLLNDAAEFEAGVNAQMAHTPTESGMRVSLRWEPNGEHPGVDDALKLLRRSPDLLGPDEREQLRAFFAEAIGSARAADPGRTFTEVLTEVLDYRAWHDFVPYVQFTGGSRQRLTRTVYRNLSGGEAATVIHLPLFAAAAAHYGAAPHGPRIIALDEAFAGIDEGMRGRLMGLLVQLDLDCVLTSHELWGTYAQVPHLVGYDLLRRPPAPGVSALEFEWQAG